MASILAPFIDGPFASAAYTSYASDLLSLGLTPGEIYQVRFAKADNQDFFTLGVDDVSLTVDTAVNIPPPPATLLLAGLAELAAVGRSRRGTMAASRRGGLSDLLRTFGDTEVGRRSADGVGAD